MDLVTQIGVLVLAAFVGFEVISKVILVIAVAFGTINVIGGFLVTDRMLGMFKRKPPPKQVEAAPAGVPVASTPASQDGGAR